MRRSDRRPLARPHVVAALLAAAPIVGGSALAAQEGRAETPVLVERRDIVAAMLEEKREAYDFALTANAVRLQAGVILRLARAAGVRSPAGPPLVIDHSDYFGAYLEVTGLEAADAPTFMRIACEHGENQVIEFRRERVIDSVVEGDPPILAITVVGGWRGTPARQYAYDDTTSSPRVRIIHQRTSSYRILDFGDMIVHDEVRGIGGRATSGVLGAIFKVIGYGWATHSRTARGLNGYQVMRATARKGPISISQTVTIRPDGVVDKDVPRDRPDLRALEPRLKRPLKIKYHSPNLEALSVADSVARGSGDCGARTATRDAVLHRRHS